MGKLACRMINSLLRAISKRGCGRMFKNVQTLGE